MKSQLFLSFLFLLCPLLSISFLKISNSKIATTQIGTISCVFLITQTHTTPSNSNIQMLGSAAYYAVLAGSAVTIMGPTKLIGSAGVYPTGSLIGNEITYTAGEPHVADTYAQTAQKDLAKAYDKLLTYPHLKFNNLDLSGQVLYPGVYAFSSSALLSAIHPLTLDARGDLNAVWVFKIVSTFTAVESSKINIINGGLPDNVYWQVGSSATVGANAKIVGNIIAFYSITFGAESTIDGRILAVNGAVDMNSNIVKSVDCTNSLINII